MGNKNDMLKIGAVIIVVIIVIVAIMNATG